MYVAVPSSETCFRRTYCASSLHTRLHVFFFVCASAYSELSFTSDPPTRIPPALVHAPLQVSPDGKQVLQKVEVVGRHPEQVRRMAEVQLSREEDECWRVDAITLGPVLEKRS